MPFEIDLILFLLSYVYTYSVDILKYSFPLVPSTISTDLQCGCAGILTQLINPNKFCREINPNKINFGSCSVEKSGKSVSTNIIKSHLCACDDCIQRYNSLRKKGYYFRGV